MRENLIKNIVMRENLMENIVTLIENYEDITETVMGCHLVFFGDNIDDRQNFRFNGERFIEIKGDES
jgi:hypothetical protein